MLQRDIWWFEAKKRLNTNKKERERERMVNRGAMLNDSGEREEVK